MLNYFYYLEITKKRNIFFIIIILSLFSFKCNILINPIAYAHIMQGSQVTNKVSSGKISALSFYL